METVQQFGPNVVNFQMETGERRCNILGSYLAPDDTLTIESVVAALKERPSGAELLVAGDFNVNQADPEGDRRGEDIATAMAMEGLGICRCTSSRAGAHGVGMRGRGA